MSDILSLIRILSGIFYDDGEMIHAYPEADTNGDGKIRMEDLSSNAWEPGLGEALPLPVPQQAGGRLTETKMTKHY